MFKRTKVCNGLLIAFGGTLTLGATSASAQQQLDRVEITGSAIKRIDAETSVPVTVIRIDDLKKQGVNSVEEVISRLAASTSTQTTAQTVGAGTGGASFADLRGIGSDKTLILLNGRRLANNAISASSTDINTIPFAALERVEVLRDGASALYGTDAIGGVINFITRKSYTSGDVTINYEDPQHSGGKARGANGSIGFGNLDNDGFNIMGVLDYQKVDRINSQQRSFGSRSYIPERGFDKTSGTTFPANYSQTQVNDPLTGKPFLDPKTGLPAPRVFNANPTFPDCAPLGNGGSINTGSATNCRFDPAPFQDLTASTERATLFTRGSLKLGENNVLSGEYFWSRNNVYTRIGPVPQTGLVMTSLIPVDPTKPDGPKTSTRNPYFPGNGITPAPTATGFTIDPNVKIGVNWRTVDAGGRGDKNQNTSQRFVLALDGNYAGWDYNVAGSYNENKVDASLVLGYNNDSLIQSGVTSGILNPFGEQSAAGAAYLQDAALRGNLQVAKGKVYTVDGRASRELGDWLGAGTPAAIAIGAEFREEKFSDVINADVASQAASTGLDPAGSVSQKSRKVYAVYSELNVPLLKTLEGTLAVRYDKYSDFGDTLNPKVGLRFQPIPEFLTRASFSTGFRAPSLYELYQPLALTFTGNNYNDPIQCPNGEPAAGANPGIACGQQFLAQTGGNKDLQPEKAKNFTLGFVVEPVKDATLEVDFWWIRLKNAINAFPESAIFGDPVTYASRFHRAPDGSLDPDQGAYIDTLLDNLGKTRTDGIDFAGNYRYRLGEGNSVTTGFLATYVHSFKFQREIDGPYFQNVGANVDNSVIFRWKYSLNVAYNTPDWTLGVVNRFASRYQDQNEVDPEFFNHVSSYTLFDVYGSYTVAKAWTLTLGVKNVFDRDPPFSNQGFTFQAGYDPRYTDPTGRAYYARLNYVFK